MKHYRYVKIILISLPIFILAVLLYKDFNPAGQLTVVYDFCRPTPFISGLSPHGRVLSIEKKDGQCSQSMVIDPVYFDVRLPQSFSSVDLTLWYHSDPPDVAFKIGPAINARAWQWNLRNLSLLARSSNYSIGRASYTLNNNPKNQQPLRFMISSPSLHSKGARITFYRLKLEFHKTPLNKNNFFEHLKNWLKFTSIYRLKTVD